MTFFAQMLHELVSVDSTQIFGRIICAKMSSIRVLTKNTYQKFLKHWSNNQLIYPFKTEAGINCFGTPGP